MNAMANLRQGGGTFGGGGRNLVGEGMSQPEERTARVIDGRLLEWKARARGIDQGVTAPYPIDEICAPDLDCLADGRCSEVTWIPV
jgi:hypothetical protein